LKLSAALKLGAALKLSFGASGRQADSRPLLGTLWKKHQCEQTDEQHDGAESMLTETWHGKVSRNDASERHTLED
jgi:hypothetical protein